MEPSQTKTALVIKEQYSTAEISITSDLSRYQAMQRRTLALDLTVVAYEMMRKWIDRLFALYSQPPAPGLQRISQAQLLRADWQAFIGLSKLFTGSPKAAVVAGKPLDPYVEELECDMTVTYFMLPVPTSHSAGSTDKVDKTDKDIERPAAPNTKGEQPPKKFQKGASKGSNKGKKRDPIPTALRGMHSRTPQGEPICFSYNLGTCKQGASCPRKHVCAVPNCYKAHPQTEHQ